MTLKEYSEDLKAMMTHLTDKELVRGLRNALRKEGRTVARAAKVNLKSGMPVAGRKLAKGIASGETRDRTGFIVKATSSRKTGKGLHRNRYGRLRPVLVWAEHGTQERTTKGQGRKAHRTGRMRAYHFMEITRRLELPESVKRIEQEFRQQVNRIINKKYGL